jgi:hypothetical protein
MVRQGGVYGSRGYYIRNILWGTIWCRDGKSKNMGWLYVECSQKSCKLNQSVHCTVCICLELLRNLTAVEYIMNKYFRRLLDHFVQYKLYTLYFFILFWNPGKFWEKTEQKSLQIFTLMYSRSKFLSYLYLRYRQNLVAAAPERPSCPIPRWQPT